MNLENFPTNETAQEMMDMITGNGFYKNSYVGKWLFQVMGIEMEEAADLFDELREQIFPETATWGLVWHEQKYGIYTDMSLSIEKRREEILKRRDIRRQMNPARLELVLKNQTERVCNITELIDEYRIWVTFDLFHSDTLARLEGVRATIERLKPSHIDYFLGVMIEAIVLNNAQNFHFYELNFHSAFHNLGTYIKLSGSRDLDGSWLLNQWYDVGIQFHELNMQSSWKNEMDVSVQMDHGRHILRTSNLADMYGIDFLMYVPERSDMLFDHMGMCTPIQNHNQLSSVYLTRNSSWQLNGAILLDGSRNLNAEITEEEI